MSTVIREISTQLSKLYWCFANDL